MRYVTLADGSSVPQFSHSQLGVAYNCQYKWKLQYKLGKTTPTNAQMKKGSYIHGYMEAIYKFLMDPKNGYGGNPAKLSDEEIMRAFNAVLVDPSDTVIAMESLTLVKYYVDKIARFDRGLHYLAVEEHHIAKFRTPGGNDVGLEGYIDLIVVDTRDGKIKNVDHKSSTYPWTDVQAKIDSQLTFYWLMLQHLVDEHGNRVPRPVSGGFINNIVTYKYSNLAEAAAQNKLFHRFPLRTNLEAVERYGEEIGRFIDRLIEQDYYPKRWTKDCSKCPFMRVCHAELNGEEKVARELLETQFLDKEEEPRPRDPSDIKPALNVTVRRSTREDVSSVRHEEDREMVDDWLTGPYSVR